MVTYQAKSVNREMKNALTPISQKNFFQHRDHREPQRTTENKSMILKDIVIKNTL